MARRSQLLRAAPGISAIIVAERVCRRQRNAAASAAAIRFRVSGGKKQQHGAGQSAATGALPTPLCDMHETKSQPGDHERVGVAAQQRPPDTGSRLRSAARHLAERPCCHLQASARSERRSAAAQRPMRPRYQPSLTHTAHTHNPLVTRRPSRPAARLVSALFFSPPRPPTSDATDRPDSLATSLSPVGPLSLLLRRLKGPRPCCLSRPSPRPAPQPARAAPSRCRASGRAGT